MHIDYPIIDFHAHIFPRKIVEKATAAIGDFYSLPMDEDGTAETLLREGSKINCCNYIVHSVATTEKQVESINTFIAEEQSLHPEFVGFATLHPNYRDIEKELDRAEALGLHGIKIHPDFQHFALDSEEAIRMFRLIGKRFPVLIHTGDYRYEYSNPIRMAAALDKVPELIAIGAHFGGYSEWEESKKYLLGRENFYIDTSSSLFKLKPDEAADMIREHGVDRTFFGTDYPMWNPTEELERFMKLPLTEDEKKKILYLNAKNFLHI